MIPNISPVNLPEVPTSRNNPTRQVGILNPAAPGRRRKVLRRQPVSRMSLSLREAITYLRNRVSTRRAILKLDEPASQPRSGDIPLATGFNRWLNYGDGIKSHSD